MKKIKTVGILGYGRFGRLLHSILSSQPIYPFSDILIFDETTDLTRAVQGVSFETAVQADIILPAVPISQFATCLKEIGVIYKKNRIQKSPLVIDICSVMVHPAKMMLTVLPPTFQLLATHPLFGPDSAGNGLTGLSIAVHPLRLTETRFEAIVQFLEQLGLSVIHLTPAEHDRAMAYSQAFAHLVGRIGERLDLKPAPTDTKGFKQLLTIQQYVVNDRMQLFYDMLAYNPFVPAMIKEFKHAMADIEEMFFHPL